MEFIFFLILLFFVIVGAFSLLGRVLGNFFVRDSKNSTFVDKSIHIHHYYYDNRSINVDGENFKKLKN